MTHPTDGALANIRSLLMIDDHRLFREALELTLRSAIAFDDVRGVATMGDAVAALDGGFDPDAIVLDLDLPDAAGADAVRRLAAAAPRAPVMAVSARDDEEAAASAIAAGAAEFVRKDAARGELLAAFRRVCAGGGPQTRARGAAGAAGDDAALAAAAARVSGLTERQLMILDLIAERRSSAEIALRLSMAETAVRAHVTAILRRLGLTSRAQAAALRGRAGPDGSGEVRNK